MELNKIYNIDCLEGLKQLPDNSIDLIITSPPYNLGSKHHTGNNRFESYTDYNDDMPELLYQEWQIKILNECYRVLKDNGSMWYNHKNRIKNGVQITPYEWILKSKFANLVKQEIIWFNGSQNFDKCRFYPMTERVYWFAKNKDTKMFNVINHHDFFDTRDWKQVGTKGIHKRAYPEKMVEDIISCFTNSDVILDPFCGSGTTCLVAKKMSKNYIGFEISEEYVKMANERIENQTRQFKLDI